MAIDLPFRRRAVRTLTNRVGCYVLCDLDQVPIYVGQSTDGIRSRVNRHLTSARSDIIANRQIDVWEIAWVWAYPVDTRDQINPLEDALFHEFHGKSALMNGTVPKPPAATFVLPKPAQVVQVMADEEIAEKRDPALRLPRQAEHYSQIVGHFLAVKNSKEIAGAIKAHFERLHRYHRQLLGLAVEVEGDDTDH
ncbi:GIY-YIG nuclease family protein [Mesorhizobium sp. B3-1-3]|uniref:GIY-YIG nuclease family protein n=1 Tax=unclassified Mesorhizobium TaxID=325217 RepID=UPI00112886C2|nr:MULTISPECIES: GIY-YIG nuclease family protein [unclassified Mesorhizobium]TPI67576.1 GIY-YIG nuclease family protein [Mesorhizobium sp. B3-1-8]TPI75622.1 GIY-YIG nuclease family protein [Mesorhizobium sp. B3-1-3]